MRVLDGVFKGVQPGTPLPLAGLDLPVTGDKGLLIVFWKAM